MSLLGVFAAALVTSVIVPLVFAGARAADAEREAEARGPSA